jgi:predicted glutamine amidotransferase
MCRMIIALGEVEASTLLNDLVLIAQGKNEINERNPHLGSLKHSDGWGMAYLEDNKWKVYKSVLPIYEDRNIERFTQLRTKAIILHVRKATRGKRCIENTQPITHKTEAGEFFFTHNGHINDNFEVERIVEGDSDTVLWFNKILSELNRENLEKIYSFSNYSSANFFLVMPDKIVVGQNYTKNPKYHTMKCYKEGNMTIISSEILPAYKDGQWEKLDNGSILELNF